MNEPFFSASKSFAKVVISNRHLGVRLLHEVVG